MIDIQELALFEILKKKQYIYIKPELITYFTDINKKVYEIAFELLYRRVEVNENTIKNCVNIQNWNDTIKKMTINQVHNIYKKDIMSLSGVMDIPKKLEEHYFNRQFVEMQADFNNTKLTLEIKKRKVLEVSEKILSSNKVTDKAYYSEIIKEMHDQNKDGNKSDFSKRIIKLEDENLRGIYGDFIYPQYHGITAKPRTFKTTLALNLISHLDELGKKSALFSFEDTKDMCSIKILAIKSGMDKDLIVRQKYNNEKFETAIAEATKNIIIFEDFRNSKELYNDATNLCNTNDIDFLYMDYIQLMNGTRGQSDYERLTDASKTWFRLIKENHIAGLALSQVDKSTMISNGFIELGAEKGSAEMANNLRHNISLNTPMENLEVVEGNTPVIAYMNKVTFGQEHKKLLTFEPKSGRLNYVGNYNE